MLKRHSPSPSQRLFCQGASVASSPVLGRHINVGSDMNEDDCLLLSWAPDRTCQVRYLGNRQFRVEASQNTRLQADRMAANYVCGKCDGIRFERL